MPIPREELERTAAALGCAVEARPSGGALVTGDNIRVVRDRLLRRFGVSVRLVDARYDDGGGRVAGYPRLEVHDQALR